MLFQKWGLAVHPFYPTPADTELPTDPLTQPQEKVTPVTTVININGKAGIS